jgi:hypothetical protein
MHQATLAKLISAVRPRAILRDIATFWGFRSTVNGPALRAASDFLVRRYQENGLQAELHEYAADDCTPYLDGLKLPLAWSPRAAALEIVEPTARAGLLCSYAEEPLCLISNSAGTPPGGVCAEVVVVHNADDPASYAGLDLRGKIVFADVWPLRADGHARQHGALGLITDSVTPPWLAEHPPVRAGADVPDLTMWGVLNGHPGETALWGFSLTPRQGARLRELIRQAKAPVMLRAEVDASLEPGLSQLTSAVLPGTDLAHEEIWILAHSSEPGAIDNASGCSAALEIGRMLQTLTANGSLPRPRRTIRFLSAVETEGYLPYIQERLADLPQVKAALAFDSVGADFRKTGGIMMVHRSPDYNLSFVDDLLELLLVEVAAQGNERFSDDPYDLFPWQVAPCFPGNDNMIADGFFDIPTPMLVCWPDKFYHSNLDAPDKLSEGSLARATVIGAAYAYLLAAAGPQETRWMAALTLQAWKRRLLSGASARQGVDALLSVAKFEPALQAEVDEMIADLLAFEQREQAAARWQPTPAPQAAIQRTPPEVPGALQGLLRPLQWKPPTPEQLSAEGKARLEALRQQQSNIEAAWWLLNGRRTAQEVCARSTCPAESVVEYLGLLLAEGKITMNAQVNQPR